MARCFGWRRVPDATTFGRWRRRAADALLPVLDDLTWYLVRTRGAAVGVPEAVTVVLDSTVVQRSGAQDWLRILVRRLRGVGVRPIAVRLDKGGCSQAMVDTLTAVGVDFVREVPNHAYVRRVLAPWRQSLTDPDYWTSTGTLHGAHRVGVERRRPIEAPDPDSLDLPTETRAHVALVLTNRTDRSARTTWRTCNAGTLVEQRIRALYQLGLGATAVDDLGGNAVLAALTGVAYQVLHVPRTTALRGRDHGAPRTRITSTPIRAASAAHAAVGRGRRRCARPARRARWRRSGGGGSWRATSPALPRAAIRGPRGSA